MILHLDTDAFYASTIADPTGKRFAAGVVGRAVNADRSGKDQV